MDRVRFGRALGGGARDAARALMKAADAASAASPPVGAKARPPTSSKPQPAKLPRASTIRGDGAQRVAETVAQARNASGALQRGGRRFGEAVWAPVVKLSGVVWLEVTGVLFSLFAITAAVYLWQHRADIHSAGTPRQNLFFAAGMLALFGFFTLSSFVRARHRSRQ